MIECTLYPGQVEAHRTLYSFWSAGDPIFGLVSPTGSGKSAIVQSLIVRLESESAKGRRGCKSVFVIVPQTHIQDSFRRLSTIEISGEKTYSTGTKTWLPERSTTTKRLTSMMRARGRSQWFGVTCSYQRLQNALTEAQARGSLSLTGRLLVVDEAHHAGDSVTNLHRLTKTWTKLGGRVLLVTATPYRHDGREVFKDGQPRYLKTIAEYAMDVDNEGRNLAPTRMWMCAERLSGYVVTTRKELDGDACPPEVSGHATLALTSQWARDGRPKLVVVVPSHGSKNWAARVQKAFEKRGARVLNAVGMDVATKKKLRDCLEREALVTQWGHSEVDVILACRRFDEGTDWPACSHLYVIGFPRSLPLTIQRWGRTFRSKRLIEGHTHPEDAKIVFFCPDPSQVDQDVMRLHRQAALFAACHLHDYQTAQQYARRLGISKVIDESLRAKYEMATVWRLVGQIKPTAIDRAQARVVIQSMALKGKIKIAEVCRRLADCGLTVSQHLAALTELLEGVSSKDFSAAEAQAFRKALNRALGKTRPKGDVASSPKAVRLVTKGLLDAFNEVLDAYGDIEVKKEKGVWRMAAMFTGETVKELSAELAKKLAITMEEARTEIQRFYDTHGRRPVQRDMRALDSWLRSQEMPR